jgi:hypothetical protein
VTLYVTTYVVTIRKGLKERKMSEKIRRISKSALLGNGNGKKEKVYVSPSTNKVSSTPTADSIAVDRTTWWEAKSEGEPNSPLFSTPQVKDKLKLEASEMCICFPDFDLYEDGKTVFWKGKIDGMGEIKVTYPETYPAQKITIEALDLEASFNDELNQLVRNYDGITPVGSIIVAMRLFLQKFQGEKECNGT